MVKLANALGAPGLGCGHLKLADCRSRTHSEAAGRQATDTAPLKIAEVL